MNPPVSVVLYVETNWFLQYANAEEELGAVDQILALAEAEAIDLVVPAFALGEAHAVIAHRGSEVRRALIGATGIAAQMRRSPFYAAEVAAASTFFESMHRWQQVHLARFETLLQRIGRAARCPGLSPRAASMLPPVRAEIGLAVADAAILATILDDLDAQRGRSSAFVSTDRAHFGDPSVKARLAPFGCRYIARFDQAVQFAEGGA